MGNLRVVAVAVAGLALAGCGKSMCTKLGDDFATYEKSSKSCSSLGVSPSIRIGDACSANGGNNCTSDDSTKLEAYGACIAAVPACTTGQEQPFLDAESACLKNVMPTGLSSACTLHVSLICSTLTGASGALDGAAGGCAAPPAYSFPLLTGDGCYAVLAQCQGSDVGPMQDFSNCVSGLAACEDGKEAAFTAAYKVCTDALTAALSGPCATALKPK